MKFEMTQATDKGKRPYQEDRLVVYWVPDEGYLLATFDGHGGSECADYCAKNLTAIFHNVSAEPNIYEGVINKIFKGIIYLTSERTHDRLITVR